MAERTEVIKKISENTGSYNFQGNPMYVHTVTLQDGSDWEYHSKSQTCEKFEAAKEATFTTEIVTDKIGKQRNRIKPVQVQKGPAFKAGYKAQAKDEGRISALSCASTAVNYYAHRQGSEDQVMALAQKIFDWAASKSDSK